MTCVVQSTARHQRGVALITALVIMAIAATIAAGMIWQGDLDTRRTETLLHGDQAMEYALGAESWAEQIMQRDFKQNASSVNLGQDWAQQLPPLPVEGGQITGHIEDMQGRFNLDLLQNQGQASTTYLSQFQRLLTALNLDPNLAYAVSDWVNNGTVASPNGAKDDFYSRLQPPYLTAMAPMTSVSELELVKGMTPEIYAALQPYVCAIPVNVSTSLNNTFGGGSAVGSWSLNVNTASPLLLMSLAPNISEDQVDNVVAAREANGISLTDFTHEIQLPTTAGSGTVAYGISSGYFLLTVTAEIGSTHVTLYSLLHNNGGTVTAVRRTFGTL